jgi:predicted O-methyltransferase YrrM
MSQETWTAVDEYLAGTLVGPDPALDAALEATEAAGLPAIAVSPTEGKLLFLLARLARATSILEIGTLGGYSAIWLGRALPADGRLVTLEADAKHAEVARANLDKAGLGEISEIRLGPALDILPTLTGPFDLTFIDADKQNNPGVLPVGAGVLAAGQRDRGGQRDPRRRRDRRRYPGSGGAGRPADERAHRRRTPRGRHRAADRRAQGLRRYDHRRGRRMTGRRLTGHAPGRPQTGGAGLSLPVFDQMTVPSGIPVGGAKSRHSVIRPCPLRAWPCSSFTGAQPFREE